MNVDFFDIKVRPIDGEYIMGDDLKLSLSPNTTIQELAEIINDKKNIPLSRMVFVLPPNRELKNLSKNLRQSGIYNNGVVRLHPTRENIWEWEDIEYYVKQVIGWLLEKIDPLYGTSLQKLKEEVKMPRSMRRVKMITFLRKYPDIFQVELNTTGYEQALVKINKTYDMPTWIDG